MYFTSGQNRAFERLMQEKPGYGVWCATRQVDNE